MLLLIKDVDESEEDSNNETIEDPVEDEIFDAPTPRERRCTSKKDWITPRLCAALDKAKVKRIRLEK